MKKIGLILLSFIVMSGCASMETSRSKVAWYDGLNPTDEETLSDWAILDLDAAYYTNSDDSFAEEMSWQSVELFW